MTDRKPITGIHVTTEKEVTVATISCLQDMQRCVGGLIEPIMLYDASTMYVNEEAKIHRLPFNSIAYDLALMNSAVALDDAVLGDVLIVGPLTRGGYDTSVTAAVLNQITRVAREAITDSAQADRMRDAVVAASAAIQK